MKLYVQIIRTDRSADIFAFAHAADQQEAIRKFNVEFPLATKMNIKPLGTLDDTEIVFNENGVSGAYEVFHG